LLAIKIFSFLARKTKTDLDDKIIEKLNTPLRLFATISAIYAAIQYSFPGFVFFGMPVPSIYLVLFYALLAVAVNRVADVFLVWYGREIVPNTSSKVDNEIFPFLRNIIKIAIYAIFAVFVLEQLGVAIAPLLAGLGIAGLAVGLALQDTLSNFFAGIHILTDKPFREGDFISLDNGVSGTIDTIGWRSSRIKNLDGNHIIIPNGKLSQSVITNYYAPDQKAQIIGEIGVSYEMDIDSVEKIIFDSIKLVQSRNDYFSKAEEPWVRFDKFGEYSLIFKYGYYVTKFEKRFGILKDLNRELFYTFKKNGIEIPFPVYTIRSETSGKQGKNEKKGGIV
jgi:small-conductance mechanosensitive channel